MPSKQESIELSDHVRFSDSPKNTDKTDGPVRLTSTVQSETDGIIRKKKKAKVTRNGLPWILKTFQKRFCLVYAPYEENSKKCQCGRTLDNHGVPLSQLTVERNLKWDVSKHTRHEGTNAFGEIEFHGAGRNTRAKYIRLSDNTKPVNVVKLLLREWNLEIPKLLISVTGGAKAFKLNPKLKQSFSDGLSKVAQSTGAWVITGGTNTGVMKHVGEALQGAQQRIDTHLESKKIVCIGIATWGIVNDRKKLTRCGETVKYHITNSYSTFGACLDNHHTHFLLVDHGKINSYGGEIDFRGTLERCIRELKYESKGIDGVPGVQLVLEGGPNTILTVYAAISQVPPMPVVLIKGSGRAADLLAFAVSMSYTSGPLIEMADVVEHTQLMDMIQKAYPEMDSDKWTNIYKDIMECMQFKDNITVYAMENENDASIDEAVLTAFLNAKKVRAVDQLNLAMIWNRVDIARTKIFVDENKWTQSDLEESMKNALSRDKPEFVELLLENGVSMNQFLTVNRLEALYNNRAMRRNNILSVLLEDKSSNGGLISLTDVSHQLSKLLGMRIRPPEYVIEKKTLKKVILYKVTEITDRYFEHPFHELFIWAVLSNMIDMATCLWTHGEEALAKALIAKKLFEELALIADHNHMLEDVVDELRENARIFDDFSVKLLQECFYNNNLLAGRLVTYNLVNWGHETCLSLAVASYHLNFVAHSCCQDLLSSRWTGALQLHGMQAWKIFLCLIFPPGIFLLRFRTQKQRLQIIMTEAEHQQNLEYIEFGSERDGSKSRSSRSSGARKSRSNIAETHNDVSSDSQNDRTELISNNHSNSIIIKGSTISGESYEMTHETTLSKIEKIKMFFNAPVTKFWSNVYAYLLFLLLFGFVITTELPKDPFKSEWLLVVIIFTLFTEEIRQVAHSDAPGIMNKIKNWGSQYWNLCDAVAILLFLVGFVFRMCGETVTGHVLYSIDIMFWILRLLDIFTVHKQIGPYVVMIGKMTIDMAYFMFIFVVFLVAYGVSRYAILNPNEKRSFSTFGKILMIPYFQIYGELFVEYPTQSNNETIFSTPNHFDHIEPLVAIIMAIYLLVANILLLNLLIAIFNNTYSIVQANSNVIWKFQRYNLIQEYSSRPVFVPPLIIFSHIYSIGKTLISCCQAGSTDFVGRDRRLKYFPAKNELHDLMLFEEKCLESFLRKRHTILFSTPDEKLRMISERVDGINMSISESKQEYSVSNRLQRASHTSLEEKIDSLERIIKVLSMNINHIQSSLQQAGMMQEELPPSFRRKLAASQGIHRSISEYHHLQDNSSMAGIKPPPSPLSLPAHQNIVGRLSDPGRSGLIFPNRHPSRASAVKKAALQFRKASLDADSVLDSEEKPKPKRFSESDAQNENDVGIVRSNTYPKPRPLSTVPSEEENEQDGNAMQSSNPFDQIPLQPHQRLKSLSFVSTIVDADEKADDNKVADGSSLKSDSSSHYQSMQTGYDNQGYDTVDGKDINLEFDVGEDIHALSRTSIYPLTNVKRFLLPDHLVPWEKSMPEYNPPTYTSPMVLATPNWADHEYSQCKENNYIFNDDDGNVDRKSSLGIYEIVEGLPRNPKGRTGLQGRGLLGRYGPNHMTEYILTRQRKDALLIGSNVYDMIEVLTFGGQALPQDANSGGGEFPDNLRRVFSKETLLSLNLDEEKCEKYMKLLEKIIVNRKLVYEGYWDNERNTDNAWLETSAYHYHDDRGDVFSKFLLTDNFPHLKLQWVEATLDMNLQDHQMELIEYVLKEMETKEKGHYRFESHV